MIHKDGMCVCAWPGDCNCADRSEESAVAARSATGGHDDREDFLGESTLGNLICLSITSAAELIDQVHGGIDRLAEASRRLPGAVTYFRSLVRFPC